MSGCYNHPPFKKTVVVQDGWTEDGRRNMIEQTSAFQDDDCHYSLSNEGKVDADCDGCSWRKVPAQ